MAYRNRWRKGVHLKTDDLYGVIHYSDEVIYRYDGVIMPRAGHENEVARHPQEFVRAFSDPFPTTDPRPDFNPTVTAVGDANIVAGVRQPTGAAAHLYPSKTFYAIPGDAVRSVQGMVVMASAGDEVLTCARRFFVRPD